MLRVKEDGMVASEQVAQLRQISGRIRSVNEQVSQRLVATSSAPDLMAKAYAAINGEVSGSEGMSALRAALKADGVADEHLDAIDALYVRCLLDPSL
jgi:hypothetical protein